MRKSRMKYLCILSALLLLTGCSRGKELDVSGMKMYYVNAEGNGLEKESYEIKGDTTEEEIESVLEDMGKEPDSIDYKSAIPEGVDIENWKLDKGRLDIYFSESYGEIDAASEVLLRAAVVQTMVQIAGVDSVDFYVGDAPLTDNEGEQEGYMRAEDFVQNIGSSLHSYQLANLHLYYASKKGDKLAAEEVSVRYNSNMSIEKLVVEQLIKGPSIQDLQPVIPPETKLLGVSVKDGICYVNFDNGFLNAGYSLDPVISVYAIVNSIIEAGGVSQVQISVNGETDIVYREIIDLSKPLSRNLDLEEREEK